MTAEDLLRYSHEPYRQELVDERVDLGDVVPGWTPRVGDFVA